MDCCWKSIYQELKKVKSWNVTFWDIIVQGCQSDCVTVWNRSRKFVFINKRNRNCECQRLTGLVYDWLVHWHRVVSSPVIIKVCRNFKEGLFWFGDLDALNIKYFLKIHFSQTLIDIHRFPYWLVECLQLNRIFVTRVIDFTGTGER